MSTVDFAELVCATSYSFLRGAALPSDMVTQAIALGFKAIGIADRNSVAGVVRAYVALRDAPGEARDAILKEKEARGEAKTLTKEEEQSCQTDLCLISGARLVFSDGTPDIIAYPTTRHGWGRLTRLLTVGNVRAIKGDCILKFSDLPGYSEDILFIVLPYSTAEDEEAHKAPPDYQFEDEIPIASQKHHLSLVPPPPPVDLEETLQRLALHAPGRVWLGVSIGHNGPDTRRLAEYHQIAETAHIPLIATNDALYATPDQHPLHDVMTCIRTGTTIHKAGRLLEANGERHLKSPAAMKQLFRTCPQAIAETVRFIERITFVLTDLKYQYPHEPVPEGWEANDWLAHLVWEAAEKRHGDEIPDKLRGSVEKELAFIRGKEFPHYFLTVHDLVKFAREQKPPILCQGRGSAANSAVCFLLGVTSVDPMKHDLLFSRFVSEDRGEPPDIDVDFEHERREEVMQYVYKRYGRHRAGIAATVIHYRPRSAVREVGKVLGLTEDVTTRLAGTIWGSWGSKPDDNRLRQAGFDPDNPEIARLKALSEQILQFPRHLSQHVGGFVLTERRLDETVPIHNAAMKDRNFIEWDKDDIDALGLMKVDVLALGMLTCIRKAYDIMRANDLGDHDLTVDIDSSDPAVYDMLCTGDSIGVFQVESRAQINMLPRLRPRTLYDLTIQVAIVRPGPIQGNMVHPYLKRRELERKNPEREFKFPKPAPPANPRELYDVLGKTLGVPLFQEQAMNLAIVAAEFSDSEANKLRRAMATFRNVGGMDAFEDKLIGGMVRRGYEPEFAERCYRQIQGFGSYGFPESHALSFARLVYVSAWIKCHHPAIFAAALLNSQPMGFYAPAQIVRDAREHGVEVRAADVNESGWDNGVTAGTLMLGFRQIDGFRKAWADAISANQPFTAIEDLARRARLPPQALRKLADADALRSLGADRREGAWEVRRTPPDELPLFAAARARELAEEPDAHLPAMQLGEHIAADYQTIRLSLKGHPMQILRPQFEAEGVTSSAGIAASRNGSAGRVAGIVLVRQRPGNGKAIFVTLEDETGVTNIIMWARTFERYRVAVMSARLMEVQGEVQKSPEGVIHLMAHRIIDRSPLLATLSEVHKPNPQISRADVFAHPQAPRHARTGGHPRAVRTFPKSRDFH